MIKSFINTFKNLEKKIVQIMKYGFTSSLITCLISSLVVITYELNPISLDLYYSGLLLFRSGIMMAASFIVCGVAFDTIQKNLAK